MSEVVRGGCHHAEGARLAVELVVGELLDDRAEGDCREERQRADDEDHADEQSDEHRSVGPEGASSLGRHTLCGQHASKSECGDHLCEPPEEHGDRLDHVVEGTVAVEPREGGSVVVRGRRDRVEDLSEAVWPPVQGARPAGMYRDRDPREDEHEHGHHEDQ